LLRVKAIRPVSAYPDEPVNSETADGALQIYKPFSTAAHDRSIVSEILAPSMRIGALLTHLRKFRKIKHKSTCKRPPDGVPQTIAKPIAYSVQKQSTVRQYNIGMVPVTKEAFNRRERKRNDDRLRLKIANHACRNMEFGLETPGLAEFDPSEAPQFAPIQSIKPIAHRETRQQRADIRNIICLRQEFSTVLDVTLAEHILRRKVNRHHWFGPSLSPGVKVFDVFA
jgi:hypothetical protein